MDIVAADPAATLTREDAMSLLREMAAVVRTMCAADAADVPRRLQPLAPAPPVVAAPAVAPPAAVPAPVSTPVSAPVPTPVSTPLPAPIPMPEAIPVPAVAILQEIAFLDD